MLEEKDVEIEVTLPDGRTETKIYVLSKFPATVGRHIITQYPISGIPKLGDYGTNEEIMLKILAHVAVYVADGKKLVLSSRALVDNHVPDWEALAKIEWRMMEYNVSFFREGKASNFFDDLTAKLPALISAMLTPLLEQLSQKNQPPSES